MQLNDDDDDGDEAISAAAIDPRAHFGPVRVLYIAIGASSSIVQLPHLLSDSLPRYVAAGQNASNALRLRQPVNRAPGKLSSRDFQNLARLSSFLLVWDFGGGK